MTKNVGVAVAVVVALTGLAVGYHALTVANQNGAVLSTLSKLGGGSAVHTFYEQFLGGLETASVINGSAGVETLTPGTTTTLTANQLCSGKTLVWTPTATNATATLPTTANLVANCLPKVGMFLDFQLRSGMATGTWNVVAGTGQTIYHVMEFATTTAQGTTITSSTPAWYRVRITVASGTDSTAQVFQTKYLTP